MIVHAVLWPATLCSLLQREKKIHLLCDGCDGLFSFVFFTCLHCCRCFKHCGGPLVAAVCATCVLERVGLLRLQGVVWK